MLKVLLQETSWKKTSKAMLVGAHIVLEGTSFGTMTDEHGNFKLQNIKPGPYKAVFSHIGYQVFSQDVEVKDQSVSILEVQLKPGNIQLSDLMVTGER